MARNCAKNRDGFGRRRIDRKVDDLDEQPRRAVARLAHDAHEVAQSGQKAIVPDAQQRAAGYVADTRRLDHDRSGAAAREALVPIEDVGGDEAVFAGPPGNHGGNPGSLRQCDRSDLYGGE